MHRHAITGRHDAIKITFFQSSILPLNVSIKRGVEGISYLYVVLTDHSIANIHEIAKLFPVYNSSGETWQWSCPASAPTVIWYAPHPRHACSRLLLTTRSLSRLSTVHVRGKCLPKIHNLNRVVLSRRQEISCREKTYT